MTARPRVWTEPGRDITAPAPGWFRMRLVAKGPYVGARIFMRLGMLAAEIAGAPADVDRVWTSGAAVDERTFDRLMTDPHPAPHHPVHLSPGRLQDAIEEQVNSDWWHTRPII